MFDPKKMGIFPPQTTWNRIRLFFKPKLTSIDSGIDGTVVITYKVLDGVIYVLKESKS